MTNIIKQTKGIANSFMDNASKMKKGVIGYAQSEGNAGFFESVLSFIVLSGVITMIYTSILPVKSQSYVLYLFFGIITPLGLVLWGKRNGILDKVVLSRTEITIACFVGIGLYLYSIL